MPKVFITGSTAFVGSHLADFLINNELGEVYGLRRPRSRDEFVNRNVKYFEGDVQDYYGISKIIKTIKPDLIFHLAAQSFVPLSWEAPESTLLTNGMGTNNILEAVRQESPYSTVLVACSSEEYGLVFPEETPIKETNPLRPQSPYGVSKVYADFISSVYTASYGTKVVITRAFNHTGPRRGKNFVTSDFARQIAMIECGLQEPIIRVGNLSPKRDWTDVRDMVRAYWLAIHNCEAGVPYNICSGVAYSIEEMLDTLLTFTTVTVDKVPMEERYRPSDVPLLLGDCSKFKSSTGWSPKIPFNQTMEDLLNYWRGIVK